MKEYGGNVQKLVEHIASVADPEKRTKQAHILVELMRQIHPQMRDGADYSKKLWDDLYIMANFDLEVDSPYPAPPKEILGKKPMQVPYNQTKLKHKIYGRNVEILVLKAIIAPTTEERKAFISYIVKLMKSFYANWNKDNIDSNLCLNQILQLSAGKLKPEIDELLVTGIIEDANPKDGSGNKNRTNFQSFNNSNRTDSRGANSNRREANGNSRSGNVGNRENGGNRENSANSGNNRNKNRFNNNRRRN